jgi:tetratricopeptide (TPR) repeat protein
MLEKIGTSGITETGQGDRVLNILRDSEQQSNRFVVMDWDMKNIPGIDVAREIRCDKKVENLPILILTSEASKENILMARDIGVSGCLVKPFEFGTLADKLVDIARKRTDPPEHVKLIKKGELSFEQGRYDEALAFYRESQKMKTYARVLVNIGETFEKKGDYFNARNSYEKAFEANPQYLRAYLMAANLSTVINDEASAISYLEKAVSLSPFISNRLVLLGATYLKNNEEQKAEETFNEAVKQDPSKNRDVGEEYLKAGNAKMAELHFRKYLDVGKDIQVYNQLGIALRKQGEWKKAVIEYMKAIEIDRNDEGVYFNMGTAYLDGGQPDEAGKCFAKAVKINPEFNEAAEALKKLG